jgi:hypothetical protein
MITRSAIVVTAATLATTPVVAEEARRELGAHEHGHSTLNIAIEGARIEMELEAPGADLVGFEHSAESVEDQAALAQARATLMEPLALFVLPSAAGCTVESASVEVEGEGGAHAHAGEPEEHEDEEHEEVDHDDHEGEEGHSEFHAAYSLTCTDADRIDSIEFAYFETFAGAQEVQVTIITETGQKTFEVERDQPRVELQGLM